MVAWYKDTAPIVVHGIEKQYDRRTLFLFSTTNPIRKAVVWILETKYKLFLSVNEFNIEYLKSSS